jgi:hypothetical protein
MPLDDALRRQAAKWSEDNKQMNSVKFLESGDEVLRLHAQVVARSIGIENRVG